MIVHAHRSGDVLNLDDGTKISVLVVANGQVRLGVSKPDEPLNHWGMPEQAARATEAIGRKLGGPFHDNTA